MNLNLILSNQVSTNWKYPKFTPLYPGAPNPRPLPLYWPRLLHLKYLHSLVLCLAETDALPNYTSWKKPSHIVGTKVFLPLSYYINFMVSTNIFFFIQLTFNILRV